MIQRLVCCVSLAGLLFIGISARAHSNFTPSDSGQQSAPTTKTVVGKITSIGNSGTTFAVQPDSGDKQEMQFVMGKNTQVQGHVRVDTLVSVEYQPAEGGQNLAVTITARS
jgi:hypothetical protein